MLHVFNGVPATQPVSNVRAEIMQGWIVRVECVDEVGLRFSKLFDVGLEQVDMAVTAVKIVHPELTDCHMQATERLSPTAVAYLELRSGEVRERNA